MSLSNESNNILLTKNNSDVIYQSHSKKSYFFIKRTIDILGASLGLIVLSPILFIITLFIKIEDFKGPVLFQQTRVGKDGEKFTMYKFRSMVTNAEDLLDSLMHRNETTGAMFKMQFDPRVTKIGRFIRKTSMDELPQLWNVLKGEMSLVGPRPPLPREFKEYSRYDKQRLLVIPGCTGLWQVSGRSNIGFETMVEMDLRYIRKRSLILDLQIICKTFLVIFKSKNAF